MGSIGGRTLFFVTSPRSPLKMLPEIKLLTDEFSGRTWNKKTQKEFMEALLQNPAFESVEKPNDPAFSARDRINRGPKALGFVDLKPSVQLTEPGKQFLDEELSQEALLRQLLKFQLPSPYHVENQVIKGTYHIKPYLEMLRLIDTLGYVTFDEVKLFGLQLTDYRKFDDIVYRIQAFRNNRKSSQKSYKTYVGECLETEIMTIYSEEIEKGKTKTRESDDESYNKFIKTKSRNFRDYADACFRYLRATGLVSISQRGHSLSIIKDKQEEVTYYLTEIDRKPIYVDDEKAYKSYLFDTTIPALFTDNRERLVAYAQTHNIDVDFSVSTPDLKKAIRVQIDIKRNNIIEDTVEKLKSYKDYLDVMNVFNDIKEKNFYDIPLMLEWNTWRAMTMLDGGKIKANLKFDDEGQPLSTAGGNMADIICEYDDFNLTVEVTTSSGAKQYEMEGEPIARHLAKVKKESGKAAYCFFIAPSISEASVAYCYTMYKMNLAFYAGTTEIIPLNLDTFVSMVDLTSKCGYVPDSERIKSFCEYAKVQANNSADEKEWFDKIQNKAKEWLAA